MEDFYFMWTRLINLTLKKMEDMHSVEMVKCKGIKNTMKEHLADSVERAALDPEAVSSSPMLGTEIIF